MINYPLQFEAEAQAAQGTQQPWIFTCGEHTGEACVPKEFAGGGGGLSPEDLFAQALTNCFLATFQVYSQASRLTFSNVSAKSTLTVDLDDKGQPWMKHFLMRIEIAGANRPDRMGTLVEKAMRSGFVLNSVKTQIEYELRINGELLS